MATNIVTKPSNHCRAFVNCLEEFFFFFWTKRIPSRTLGTFPTLQASLNRKHTQLPPQNKPQMQIKRISRNGEETLTLTNDGTLSYTIDRNRSKRDPERCTLPDDLRQATICQADKLIVQQILSKYFARRETVNQDR